MNVYQKINEVRKQVDYVQKQKSVSTGGSSYKAVTHDEVTGIIRAHLVEQGIVIVPSLKASSTSQTTTKDGSISNVIRYSATYEFRVVNADDPADCFVMEVEAHANDNQDKAPGKALSYAKKYAVLKLFEIETGTDEESRYNANEFDIEFYLDLVNGANSLEELQTAFKEAYEAATKARDSSALKVIIKLKDKRKEEFRCASNQNKAG